MQVDEIRFFFYYIGSIRIRERILGLQPTLGLKLNLGLVLKYFSGQYVSFTVGLL